MSGDWNWNNKPFWWDIVKAMNPSVNRVQVANFGNAVIWSSDLECVLLDLHAGKQSSKCLPLTEATAAPAFAADRRDMTMRQHVSTRHETAFLETRRLFLTGSVLYAALHIYDLQIDHLRRRHVAEALGTRHTCVGASVAHHWRDPHVLESQWAETCREHAFICLDPRGFANQQQEHDRGFVRSTQMHRILSGLFTRAEGHYTEASLSMIDQNRLRTYLEPVLGAESGHSITAQRKRQILSFSDMPKLCAVGSFPDSKYPRPRRPCDGSESRNHFPFRSSLSLRADRRPPLTF
jgi:hypothetical protein